jgi:hypothetical protein
MEVEISDLKRFWVTEKDAVLVKNVRRRVLHNATPRKCDVAYGRCVLSLLPKASWISFKLISDKLYEEEYKKIAIGVYLIIGTFSCFLIL